MVERFLKATLSGWRPWAIGATVSLGLAGFLFVRRQRAALQALVDDYETWWQHRERIRANGHPAAAPEADRPEPPQLFV
jgi:hypothetical protein